jgi:hypothetical protein
MMISFRIRANRGCARLSLFFFGFLLIGSPPFRFRFCGASSRAPNDDHRAALGYYNHITGDFVFDVFPSKGGF